MKSAYELAMERLGQSAPLPKLTDAQKRQLAEIDSRYQAKIAEREILANQELAGARASGDAEAIESIQSRLSSERQKILAEQEAEKDKVRQAKA